MPNPSLLLAGLEFAPQQNANPLGSETGTVSNHAASI
jgi:hypothetical protein